MKKGFLNYKFIIILGLVLLVSSLAYLSTETKYEVKEVTKEIKLISSTNK